MAIAVHSLHVLETNLSQYRRQRPVSVGMITIIVIFDAKWYCFHAVFPWLSDCVMINNYWLFRKLSHVTVCRKQG